MAAFLDAQLDYIFFFYGLAFILLGAVSFGIVRLGQGGPWAMLGMFGIVHGSSEWLDLIALVAGDNLEFSSARTAVMTGSYVFLLEFARQAGQRRGWNVPGQWIYAPLLIAVVLAWYSGGVTTANVAARYLLGFAGAAATSCVFAIRSREVEGADRRFVEYAAIGFGIYAVAAGLITPAASFWPADVINHAWFARSTGIPIQLVRGLLACWIAFSVWAIWGRKRLHSLSSARYADHLHKQFVRTLAALSVILVFGWGLTEYLGLAYKRDVEVRSRGDLDLLASRIESDAAVADSAAKIIAGTASVVSGVTQGSLQASQHALELAMEASGATRAAILSRTGAVVASAGDWSGAQEDAPAPAVIADFRESIADHTGRHFVFDARSGQAAYIASSPIRSASGDVVGLVIVEKSLVVFGADLRRYDRTFFLVDPDGVVVLTNRPPMMLRAVWPVPTERQADVKGKFGEKVDLRPILTREFADDTWARVDGMRDYVQRRFVGDGQWSLLILKRSEEVYASRVTGIAITLLMAIMMLVYLLGREWAVYDLIQMDRRLELQELASDLRFQATTDPLTGLNNRLRFNEVLEQEMSRAQRHGAPLSLVLFDIDHFKQINDTFGHLAGDKVLIELSRLASSTTRTEDVLARWGGEEFVLLLPETDARVAYEIAEKLRKSVRDLAFDNVGNVTCSFGITQLVEDDTAKSFLSRADAALYRAKLDGRNRVEMDLWHSGGDHSLGSAA